MKEKIKILLFKIRLIPTTFTILTIYFMCFGFSASMTGAFLVISCLLAFDKWLKTKQQPNITEEIIIEINRIKAALNSVKIGQEIKRDDGQVKRYF